MRTRSLASAAGAVLAFAALSASTHTPAADSWPGYRGPTADGRAGSSKIPTTWSESENVRWKMAVHGKGWSSPVVLGKQVWVTTADETPDDSKPANKVGGAKPIKEVSFFAVCFDRETGKVVHDLKLGTEQDPAFCHPTNSYASPTPFIEEGRLYAHFGSHGTWCVDTATGKVLWDRKDLKCNHFRGPASSPVVYGDLLYLIFDGYDLQYVTALDKKTGRTVWSTDRKIKYAKDDGDIKKAYATPALLDAGGKPQLVCPSAECTAAYDPKTGQELWRIAHGGMNGSARPVMGNGLLFLTSGHNGKLLAVKPEVKPDPSGFLPGEAVAWTVAKDVPTRPSLLLDNGLLYLASDGGVASCLDAATGKVVWSERLGGTEAYYASPILAGGHVYFFGESGRTFVVEAGRTKGANVVAENRLGEGRTGGFMGSPAVGGNELYLRTKTHMYSITGQK